MTALLPSYTAVKDSGTRWLGTIPESWSVLRSKRLFTPRTELARVDDVQLSATQAYGVIPQADFERAVGRKVTRILQHLEKRRHVEVDDFVISMRSFQGGLERAWASGCIRSSYVVLRPAAPLVVGYYAYLFKSNGYIRALQSTASFIRDGQDLNFSNFCEVDLPCPPPSEQSAIARFLHHADRRIRRYIHAKQKLIKLLEEQKQAIVRRAVTRGLDAQVRVKPSGIGWIGDVPEHWEIWHVRHFAAVGNGSTPSRGNAAYWSGGTFPWLNSSSVNAGIITASDQFVTERALRECHLPRVPPGSVLVAITGQGKTRGTAAVLAIEATINQHIAFIAPRRCGRTATSDYLRQFLVAAYPELRRISEDSGSTKGALTCEDLKHFRVLLPPINEQNMIVRLVGEETAIVESGLRVAEREISLLREYRTLLIADVVTGKLDVREAAARLPEGAKEPGEDDEVDTGADVEESSDEVDLVEAEAEA